MIKIRVKISTKGYKSNRHKSGYVKVGTVQDDGDVIHDICIGNEVLGKYGISVHPSVINDYIIVYKENSGGYSWNRLNSLE